MLWHLCLPLIWGYWYLYLVTKIVHFFYFVAPERNISIISNIDIPKEQTNKVEKNYQSPTTSPGPSRINRVLTPVNQVTPLYKRYLDSAGMIFLNYIKLFGISVILKWFPSTVWAEIMRSYTIKLIIYLSSFR